METKRIVWVVIVSIIIALFSMQATIVHARSVTLVLQAPELCDISTPSSYTFHFTEDDVTSYSHDVVMPEEYGGETLTPSFISLDFTIDSTVDGSMVYFDFTDFTLTLTSVYVQGTPTGTTYDTLNPSETSSGSWNTANNAWHMDIAYQTNNALLQEKGGRMTGHITLDGTYDCSTLSISGSGTFTLTVGVGGIWVPVDKLGLLAPYIGLASTILIATAATAIYAKRARCRKEKQ